VINRRIEVFASLLLLLIAIVVAVGIFQWYRVDKEIDDIHAEDARMVIGQDEKLAETVQQLENTLKERLEYQFDINIDPLDLTRVITSKKILEKMGVNEFERSKHEMRLSATIVGGDGESAIVLRFMGSNHILRVGDLISGWKVSEISRKSALLTRGGAKKKLVNERAPESLGDPGLILSVGGEDVKVATAINY